MLLSSHSDDQLKKIFTEDRIKDLFKIIKKVLDTTDVNFVHQQELDDLLKNVGKHYFSDEELINIEKLEQKFKTNEIHKLLLKMTTKIILDDQELLAFYRECGALMEFIERKGLREECLKEKLEAEKIEAETQKKRGGSYINFRLNHIKG